MRTPTILLASLVAVALSAQGSLAQDVDGARAAEGWKITQITDTQRMEACPDPLGRR